MAEIDWDAIVHEHLDGFTAAELPPLMKLPALPHAATLFIQKANDENAPIAELARIIETDSGLTTELLKYVNSSFIGLRSKVKTVQHTLTLLGRRPAKMHIVTTATQGAVRARQSKLIHQAAFWNATLQKALFARQVAGLLKADRDLAFAGAVLQDYLLPVISNELYDDYLEFVEHRDDMPACLCEFEQQKFGWDHAFAGAALAVRWHLPADLACCILFHHAGLRILGHPQLGRTAVAAVALSALLPDELRQHRHGLEQLAKLGQKWPAFDLHALAEEVDREHEEVGLGLRNAFPLSRLCRPILEALVPA
jgi:serine/threonine-protein kinase